MYLMFFVTVLAFVISWTSGLGSWIVDFLTGLAQLGIWVSLLSLIPRSTLWVSAKTRNVSELTGAMSEQETLFRSSLFSN